MNKKVTKTLLIALSLFAISQASAEEQKVVNVWNWNDYIAEDTVENFSKKYNTKVNYSLFDSNEMVEARLFSGHSGFDTLVTLSYYVPRLAKAGAIQEIDPSKIPNYKNIDKSRLELLAEVDPGNKYAIPYAENTIGIGYNVQKIQEIFGKDYVVDSWDLVFKKENSAKLKECGIAIIDSPIEIISVAQLYNNADPMSENKKDFAKSLTMLTDLAKNAAYFHSSRYINDLATGDVCVAIGYSGDIMQAADRAKNTNRDYEIKYVFPKEGSLLWYDCWVLTSDSKNKDSAYAWLNNILDNQNALNITDEIKYILPVNYVLSNLPEEIKNNDSINLSKEKLAKAYTPKPTSAKLSRITNNLWNSMKINSEVADDSEWE